MGLRLGRLLGLLGRRLGRLGRLRLGRLGRLRGLRPGGDTAQRQPPGRAEGWEGGELGAAQLVICRGAVRGRTHSAGPPAKGTHVDTGSRCRFSAG